MASNYALNHIIDIKQTLTGLAFKGANFNNALLVIEGNVLTRVTKFLTLNDVLKIFSNNTVAYRIASIWFAQENAIPLKIVSNYKTDITLTLDDIVTDTTQDQDWYILLTEKGSEDVSSWCENKVKVYIMFDIEDSNFDSSDNTSMRAKLKEKNYSRTFLYAIPTIQAQEDTIVFSGVWNQHSIQGTFNGTIVNTINVPFHTDVASTFADFKTQVEAFFDIAEVTYDVASLTFTIRYLINKKGTFINVTANNSTGSLTSTIKTVKEAKLGNPLNRIDVAYASMEATVPVGTLNPAFGTPKEVTPADLSDSQLDTVVDLDSDYRLNSLIGNREPAVYYFYSGVGSGAFDFSDIRISDALKSRITEDLFNLLKSRTLKFDDAGLKLIYSTISSSISSFVNIGCILSESVVVSVKTESEVTQKEKTSKRLQGTSYSCTLAGWIKGISIVGTITL